MASSLGFIHLMSRLARKWIKERGASCLKIGGELSGMNCPGGKLFRYRLNMALLLIFESLSASDVG